MNRINCAFIYVYTYIHGFIYVYIRKSYMKMKTMREDYQGEVEEVFEKVKKKFIRV